MSQKSSSSRTRLLSLATSPAWVVNLLLTLLTLGLYSAWAKVRKAQYFRHNTSTSSWDLRAYAPRRPP